MKSPINAMEDIAAQISEGRTLLEWIYRESNENEKNDCYTACLLRSLDKTIDNARKYVEQFCQNNQLAATISARSGCLPDICGRIRLARENLGMSEDALAEKLDIHPGDVLAWENGADQPLAGMIIPLAEALKRDPMWLLTGQSSHVKQAEPAPVNVMKDADLASIGVRISNRRKKMLMTVEELADAADVSGAFIAEWESGEAIPPSFCIDSLAKALNTSVTWLMTGRDIAVEAPAKKLAGELLEFWKSIEATAVHAQENINRALPFTHKITEEHDVGIKNLGDTYFNEINRQAEEAKKTTNVNPPQNGEGVKH
ncbi:hypothetical protein DPO11_22975 [Salmonella enterica]|nr:hypothetical protein [Salmonella enterica]